MFLVYAYCINQRAEKATHNGENDVYMRIYKIGQSAQRRDLIAVELWIQQDEERWVNSEPLTVHFIVPSLEPFES